jgi:hypothetical protein
LGKRHFAHLRALSARFETPPAYASSRFEMNGTCDGARVVSQVIVSFWVEDNVRKSCNVDDTR